jgi:hypothetical protein
MNSEIHTVRHGWWDEKSMLCNDKILFLDLFPDLNDSLNVRIKE